MPYVEYPGFCNQTYQMFSENLAVDRAINCYPSRNQIKTGKPGPWLVSRPGLAAFATPSTGTGRALFAGDERMFGVVGTKSIEVSSGGAVTVRGDIGSGANPCYVGILGTDANAQLITLNPDTGKLYYDVGAGPTLCPTPTDVSMAAILNGFVYAVGEDTNVIFQSDFLDASSWDPLNQATSTASNDRIAQIYADNELLWVIGRRTCQPYYNAGTAGFALAPVQSGFVQEGTASPFSPVSINNVLVFVSASERGSGRVVAVTPGNVQTISTYAIEQRIQSLTSVSICNAYGYQSYGHSFYVLSFPNDAVTLVYDFTEGAWHERFCGSPGTYTEYKAYLHCFVFDNKHYVMDRVTGAIYLQSETNYQDFGTPFRRQRTAPVLTSGNRRTYFGFRADQQMGDGSTTTGCKFRYSLNGGLSYTAYETLTAGANGEAGVIEKRNMGQALPRGFVADLAWDDGLKMAVSNAYVNFRDDEF